MDFLADLFEQGLEHRTINTIRSAVSMTHKHVEGVPIGQLPLVTRLLKGVHNSRPPQPRYSSTWDVDVVLSYLISMGDNSQLSLKQLSQKLAVLMALVQASRSSELHALDVRFRVYRLDGVVFTLPTMTKNRKAGTPAKELFFGAFAVDSRLCVTQCLRQYEQLTLVFRPKRAMSFVLIIYQAKQTCFRC